MAFCGTMLMLYGESEPRVILSKTTGSHMNSDVTVQTEATLQKIRPVSD